MRANKVACPTPSAKSYGVAPFCHRNISGDNGQEDNGLGLRTWSYHVLDVDGRAAFEQEREDRLIHLLCGKVKRRVPELRSGGSRFQGAQ
jgi:hypothetical protein